MSNQLTIVKETLGQKLQEEASAMPQNFNQTRFLQNCLSVLRDTKDIDKCTPESIVSTMLKGAYLGLDFFNKEAYAIVYNKNIGTKDAKIWVKDLQFQMDYKGSIKLAKKYSAFKIQDVYAKVVREGDDFESYIKNGKQFINFKPKSFNDGKIIGAFAVVYYEDGSMLYDTMSTKEIESTRQNYSKMPDSKAWKNSTAEMYKKTVLHRICKLVSLDFDNAKQQDSFMAGSDVDVEKLKTIDVKAVENPFPTPKVEDKTKDNPFSKPPSEVKTNEKGEIIE